VSPSHALAELQLAQGDTERAVSTVTGLHAKVASSLIAARLERVTAVISGYGGE
jgi:hypothetical protein